MRAIGGRGRAQSTVEFALVLPLLLLLMAGTIEFGRAFFAYGQLLQAVQDGARYGAMLPNASNDAAIISRVRQISPGGANDSVTVSATASPTNNTAVAASQRTRGNVLQVTAQTTHQVLIPFFPLSQFTMTATASMVIETAPISAAAGAATTLAEVATSLPAQT